MRFHTSIARHSRADKNVLKYQREIIFNINKSVFSYRDKQENRAHKMEITSSADIIW